MSRSTEERLTRLEAVVTALVEVAPVVEVEDIYRCTYCGAPGFPSHHILHYPDCQWLKAKEAWNT